VLAYLFWHRPVAGVERPAYEQALLRLHRSLGARPPVGFLGSLCRRVSALRWLEGEDGYEDWYLLEDYAALGVLGEAAVAGGHRSAHEGIAKEMAAGVGGLYRLCEGAAKPEEASLCVWVSPARNSARSAVEAMLLGDGSERDEMGLWRRELVLGPAPEYCLRARRPPDGASSTRLPAGWQETVAAGETIWES
jgi:hypothetical protein